MLAGLCSLLEALAENLFSCLWQSLAAASFLHPQSLFSVVTSPSGSPPLSPSSTFKDLCDYVEPTQMTQNNLPILRLAIGNHNSTSNLKSPSLCTLTYSRDPGSDDVEIFGMRVIILSPFPFLPRAILVLQGRCLYFPIILFYFRADMLPQADKKGQREGEAGRIMC